MYLTRTPQVPLAAATDVRRTLLQGEHAITRNWGDWMVNDGHMAGLSNCGGSGLGGPWGRGGGGLEMDVMGGAGVVGRFGGGRGSGG